MKRVIQIVCVAVAVAVVVVGVGSAAIADINIATVHVGDPGNAADTRYETLGYGAVDYEYDIGKYEVTAGQYCEFLNAVAATDTFGLYNGGMSSYPYGGGIQRTGTPGSFTYSVDAGRENKPIKYVNFWDASRFANWLHNGQPTGPQDATTTEDGAYTLDGYLGGEGQNIVRNAEANVWIPSEDEWYKAAYYMGGDTSAGYWDYPTASIAPPRPEPPPGTDMLAGSANCLGSGVPLTDVGAYRAKPSDSAYGTFDQGGGVWEWNDTLPAPGASSSRIRRGGSYATNSSALHASARPGIDPMAEIYDLGFRVAGTEWGSRPVGEIQQLSDNTYHDGDPDISGSNVVWEGENGDDTEIFLYDGSMVIQLTDNNYDDSRPRVSGSNVAWECQDGGDTEIYFFDGRTTTKVTDNYYDDHRPQVSGSNVVWRGRSGSDAIW